MSKPPPTHRHSLPTPVEISAGRDLSAVAFSADGETILSCGRNEDVVSLWRVRDGQRVTTLEAPNVLCLAVSKNGSWIAAGTYWGKVIVWNADSETHEKVLEHQENSDGRSIRGLDFSADSSLLVWASEHDTATVWNVNTRQQVKTLRHECPLIAAKFSPQGNTIATATANAVRVWNTNADDRNYVHIPIKVIPSYNTGLVWFHSILYAVAGNAIQRLDPSAGSTIPDRQVPGSNAYSCIALTGTGDFMAYATNRTLILWDMSEQPQTQRSPSEHHCDIRFIAISPGNRVLAICGEDGKIVFKSLSRITNAPSSSYKHPTLQEPSIQVNQPVLAAWKHGQLDKAESLLTVAIQQHANHHLLSARALVRARLEKWDEALADARMAITDNPSESIIAYIAKSLAHIGQHERDAAYRTCDIAFEHFHSSHVTFLLLVKAIIVFMSTDHPHRDATSRMDDLINTLRSDPTCCTVQAYMLFLVGNTHMERNEYNDAIQLLEDARTHLRHHQNRSPLVISLMSGWTFDDLNIKVRQSLCEALYAADRTMDSSSALLEMLHTFDDEEVNASLSMAEWIPEFRCRCIKKLEKKGDAAIDTPRYDDGVSHYTAALALVPAPSPGLLTKRGKAYIAKGLWKEGLNDANQVIELDRRSPWGYEMKHAALHKGREYQRAINTFEAMLSRLSESSDPNIRALHCQYINPQETRAVISDIIQDAICDSPRVLIHTSSGRLCDKSEQAALFKSHPAFLELISSMTKQIDRGSIKQSVSDYYRYAMFSHRWEDREPLFEEVSRTVVRKLGESHTHRKLKMFCMIVRDARLHWAWSDTCCINRADHFVLQEALVSMFKWYQCSALTIVFLFDVLSPSRRGDLIGSEWNTRAWTFQEYHASKVVRFYTKDWKPYLNLDVHNHKQSPEIISEMQDVTGVSEAVLMGLQPGFNEIREKLYLASSRKTTYVEDEAYSLFGIFNTSLPVVYGEKDQALGRLLAQLLSSSGNTGILAWTGISGSFNSCLPAKMTVFDQPSPPHFPLALTRPEMEKTITRLRTSPLDPVLVLKLYKGLRDIPGPFFAGTRLKLPCLTFNVMPESMARTASGFVFRVATDAFGAVDIRTTDDLSRLGALILVHPWIDFLLDRQAIGDEPSISRPSLRSPSNSTSQLAASEMAHTTTRMRLPERAFTYPQPAPSEQRHALELVARLRQPFGALLFTLLRRNTHEYKRVAADSMIIVQMQDSVSWSTLIENTWTLEVL